MDFFKKDTMNNTDFPSIIVHTYNYKLILIAILEGVSCKLFTSAEVKGKNVKLSLCFIN
jgi:hypothetical protein